MIKHVFTVRWVRKGRTVTPELDCHASGEWPLPYDSNKQEARALLALVDGDTKRLPTETKAVLDAAQWMRLRVRYNNDIDGLFVMNTDDYVTRDQVRDFILHLDDDGLNSLRYQRGRPNR